jgi:hypothetical protein
LWFINCPFFVCLFFETGGGVSPGAWTGLELAILLP